MSETTSAADAARAAATEPSATETQTPPTPANDTAPPPGTEQTPPDDGKPADKTPPTPDPRDRAIRQLAFEQREARRQNAALREQLERVTPPRDPNAPPSQADFDRQVEQRAQAMLEQREAQRHTDAWVERGNAAFTTEVFNARCNALADMGAAENQAFMAAIGKLGDGHKVIVDLAENPAEAARVLRLPPVDLALALAGISQRIAAAPPPPAKAVTQAPDPIRPLATAARAEVNLESLDGDAFRAAWNKRTRG